MKIYKGTSRLVIQISIIVIKFPQFTSYLKLLTRWTKSREKKVPDIASAILRRRLFLNGIYANISEFLTWVEFGKRCRNGGLELAPTYLSLGFINIQRHIVGRILTEDEVREVLRSTPEAARKMIPILDTHFMRRRNWIKRDSDGKVFLIDYGDSFAHEGYPLSAFIAKVGFEARK